MQTEPAIKPPEPAPAKLVLNEESLRPHIYDGIQEYDKRLPRWWLYTLYGTIVFSGLYWAYFQAYEIGTGPEKALEMEMEANADIAARKSGIINDELLWKMSVDAQVIAAGKVTFETTCASCHKPDLTGLIGPNLVDKEWIHGGSPMDSMKTISEGILAKGMPAWGPLLGKQKISEVTAYIFSHHKAGEPIVPVAGWTMPGAAPAPTP